jgi:hypothetical protein
MVTTDAERIAELEAQIEHERALYRHAIEIKTKYLDRLEATIVKLKKQRDAWKRKYLGLYASQ